MKKQIVLLIGQPCSGKTTISNFIKNFDEEEQYITFVTSKGIVKRTQAAEYKNIRQNGIIAINLKENDELINVQITNGKKDLILGASNGKAIRFEEVQIRATGRTSMGVRGMNVAAHESVVGVAFAENEKQEVLVITEKGYGKRTEVSEYRNQNRGGKGVKTLQVKEKNGNLKNLKIVDDSKDLIVVTDKGVVIRTRINQIASLKRVTQGVKIIRLKGEQKVSTIAVVPVNEIEENQDLREEIE